MSLVDYEFSDEEESHCSPVFRDSEDFPNSPDVPSTFKVNCDDDSDTTAAKKRCEDLTQDKINTQSTGRVRTFAHERGNWATFIYVPIPLTDSIRDLQCKIIKSFRNDSNIKLNAMDSLHISLTRTVVLQHHWIEEFTKSVKASTIDFKKFTLNISKLNVYCNDDCTTTFVAIAVPDIYCTPLKILVEKFDNCLGEYKLPCFYKDASFHVSILWCLGNRKSQISMEVEKLEQLLFEAIDDDYEDYQIAVNRVECKVGNKVYNYPLVS